MSLKIKCAVFIAILLWASAYVGIRASLQDFSPEGLALLRYLIASSCMALFYFWSPNRQKLPKRDMCSLMAIGAIGIGLYNLSLNYGELTISSGIASFIISQSPIITAIIASLFYGEKLNLMRVLGFIVSMSGVALIATGELGGFKLSTGLYYILLATIAGGSYSVLQKPFLKKYHAIQTTTYVIWGGTLFLIVYFPLLKHDLTHASLKSILWVIYLGIFPAALSYVAWSYALVEISASQAVSFFYFMPLLATLLGWLFLDEVPMLVSFIGGAIAILGVWFVNRSYKPNIASVNSSMRKANDYK